MFEPDYFEWDLAKAEKNFAKHGLAFNEAVFVFEDAYRHELDVTRESDGESRSKVVGRLRGRLFTVVFTVRGKTCRLISARRANPREVREYGDRQI